MGRLLAPASQPATGCRRRESNSHDVSHRDLGPARLPLRHFDRSVPGGRFELPKLAPLRSEGSVFTVSPPRHFRVIGGIRTLGPFHGAEALFQPELLSHGAEGRSRTCNFVLGRDARSHLRIFRTVRVSSSGGDWRTDRGERGDIVKVMPRAEDTDPTLGRCAAWILGPCAHLPGAPPG